MGTRSRYAHLLFLQFFFLTSPSCQEEALLGLRLFPPHGFRLLHLKILVGLDLLHGGSLTLMVKATISTTLLSATPQPPNAL